jgi:hypothetical protein
MHVLTTVLGYAPEQIAEGQTLPAGLEAKMPEMGETLRPDFALVGAAGSDAAGQAQLLIASYMAEQTLDKPVIGKHWKATPATRMMELLHGTGLPLGLVTNGEHWLLVYAPRGETTGYASWYGALWLDEPITLRSFHSLFGVRRLFGVSADNTLLGMLKESANDQQEVTDQLGYQVREAVEVLVKSVDALDRENHRALLKDVPETVLYDAALTIMMRLVFLFAAEERGLLHLGKQLYDDNYAVSTLQEQLQEVADQNGEEVLERRFDAWTRLLATFRAVHGGIEHEDLLMPAYGGSLFDPDRYPFLEGRASQSTWKTSTAQPLAVNNRVVLHLLNSLQRLQVRVPGGGPAESRRISFRALGVEQIGHVYEGLLDRTAMRASEPILGVKGAGHKEKEIPLATIESAQGRDKLVEYLKDETGRSLSALRHALDEINLLDEHKLLIACGHDKALLKRIRPYVDLIREDSFGRPLVTLTDGIYVTTATIRRSTGTHYTPPSLTEPIVQHTLEPLAYEGPIEGLPREQWKLRSAQAILGLKVCDMAMGSGAFLVQACRYLAERLVEAWENLEKQHPGEVLITPEGTFSIGSPSERLVPADTNERIAIARRVVADRCLYGVDINPMAVEMAKLSLWLITLQRDRPFNFLDHALKCGDSLLGVGSIKQIDNFSLRSGEKQVTFATANLSRHLEEASAKRRTLEQLPSNNHTQIETKNRLHAEAEAAAAKVKALADCLIAFELRSLEGGTYEEQRTVAAEHAEAAMRKPLIEFQAYSREQFCGRRTFHWPFEFPEVFLHGGFQAFVGNPPFLGGQKITGVLGTDYRNILIRSLAHGKKGSADLCAYFFLRVGQLLHLDGMAGLIATNTIAQGDTREVGLEQLVVGNCCIPRANPSRPWPGGAALEVAHVWLHRNATWRGAYVLDERTVVGITPFLASAGQVQGKPLRLAANYQKSFQGSIVLGMGFVLTPDEAEALMAKDRKNSECLRRYLNGDDINSRPDQSPSRWVINFFDWPLDRSAEGIWSTADEEVRKEWLRQGSVPCDYPDPVATDYPDCLAIIEARVKSERLAYEPINAWNKSVRRYWWRFGAWRKTLDAKLADMGRYLVHPFTGKHNNFAFLSLNIVASHMTVVFTLQSWAEYALVQSDVHWQWALAYGNKLETRPQYNNTDCFETFPFPQSIASLSDIGERYYSHRQSITIGRAEGLTETYNRFHDPQVQAQDIADLRGLHVEMDNGVIATYGWDDLELEHGFHKTKLGVRYTLSDTARSTVLDRLLALNHQRHIHEEASLAARAVSAPVKRLRKKKQRAEKLTLDLL